MHVIVHGIKLHEGVEPAHFEAWVREYDYGACPQLPSVNAFTVHRVSEERGAPVHFFEVIWATSQEAFSRDMETAVFQELSSGFAKLASVVDEVAGEPIEPGYLAV